MDVSAEDFAALFAAVSSWGRWGETDERGALHYLTPARVVAAAGLVRDGITVSMSFPVDTAAAAHNPRPATHQITRLPDHDADPGSLGFAMDMWGSTTTATPTPTSTPCAMSPSMGRSTTASHASRSSSRGRSRVCRDPP
jgi:hypothetical protein